MKARIRLVLDYEVDAADMGLALDGAVLLADGDGPFRPSRSGGCCHVRRVGNAEVFSVEITDSTDGSGPRIEVTSELSNEKETTL